MTRRRSLDDILRLELSRRTLLAGGLALCGLPARLLGRSEPGSAAVLRTFSPFKLGIASGDPTPTGVVLWTRLAPDPLEGGGMPPVPVDVAWEVADDDKMKQVVRRGVVRAAPEWAHSVHVDVGGLRPDRWYWYRFNVGGAESGIGRTRTLPALGAPANRLRFAFASCSHFESGFFTAYRHLAAEDVDLMFHLGDYIYENAGDPEAGRARVHSSAEITTLEDYRNRYAQYRTDPDLQAAHAAFPWWVTWDDHEVDNNYAGDISEHDDPRDQFLLRRAAAYQAYYEHMPLRRAQIPRGPALRLYRDCSYGSLASFFILDTRQYRTNQPCNDSSVNPPCGGEKDPNATMMGAAQERWLYAGMGASRSKWNVIPQQVMVARVDQRPGPDVRISFDQWAGYDAPRTRLLSFLGTRKPANPVVLTGDIHSNWVNDLKVDFEDAKSPVVATEFVGTSITSGGDGIDKPANADAVMAENPFVKFRSSQRGYVTCEVSPDTMRADYHVVEYVTRPGAPKITRAKFVVDNGKPGAEKTS